MSSHMQRFGKTAILEEIETLRSERDRFATIANEAHVENQQLREALRDIAGIDGSAVSKAKRARAALEVESDDANPPKTSPIGSETLGRNRAPLSKFEGETGTGNTGFPPRPRSAAVGEK